MKKPIKFLLAIAAVVSFAFVNPTAETRQINVVIDAGHGGNDFGADMGTLLEKDITASIASKIKTLNQNPNVVLHFTRESDESMDLQKRTEFINEINPDLVLSLHVNANKNNLVRGVEFYVAKESDFAEKSSAIAEKLQEKMKADDQFIFRGIKQAPFFILKNTKAPAITFELGFITNPDDAKYLIDEKEQDQIARTILEVISEL